MTIENKIYLEVKERCEQPTNAYGIGAWDHHIKIVYELAKQYYKDYDAIAKEILTSENYPIERIELIKNVF